MSLVGSVKRIENALFEGSGLLLIILVFLVALMMELEDLHQLNQYQITFEEHTFQIECDRDTYPYPCYTTDGVFVGLEDELRKMLGLSGGD